MLVTNGVSRDQIKPEVINELASVTGRKTEEIEEGQLLFEDLGMGPPVRASMAQRYTKITEKHGGKPVGLKAAEKLKSVKESIDLVHKRANESKEA